MNLQQLKDTLGVPALNLNTATDKEGNATEWMRHWDNDNRVAISMHKDTVKLIQENPTGVQLGLQTEERQGSKGKYTAKRVVNYKPAEITL